MIGGACDTKARAPTSPESSFREIFMAIDPAGGHPAMDYPQHLQTYGAFIRGTVILVALIVILLLGMLYFLVP